MQINIQQPENTTRYWCPIDVPNILNTEENEIAYAKQFCNWKPESDEDRKVAICKHLRSIMTKEYKSMYLNNALINAQKQANETVNQIFQ